MIIKHKLFGVVSLLLIAVLISAPTNAAVSATWTVSVGDSAVYKNDKILYFDPVNMENPVNFAYAFLNDTTRTHYLAITSKTGTALNYTLGLFNGSQILPDQQITIQEVNVQGGSPIYLPNGSLPLVLPVSVEGQSNYLLHLSSAIGSATLLIQGLLSQLNITNVRGLTISPLYRSTFFNISASATVDNLANISQLILPQLNFTDQIGVGQNQTIHSVKLDLLASYNSTDGMLAELGLNAAINATVLDSSANNPTFVNTTQTLNVTIHRDRFISLSDQNLTDAAQAGNSSFMFLGVIPALLVISRYRKH